MDSRAGVLLFRREHLSEQRNDSMRRKQRTPHWSRRDPNMRKQALNLVGLLAVALAVTFLAPQRAVADDDDPPSRVARLSYARGNVSFEPAGTEVWVSAVVNRPITTGDKLWSDNGAKAELNIGSAAIRLGSS